jgi:hypothetical protein
MFYEGEEVSVVFCEGDNGLSRTRCSRIEEMLYGGGEGYVTRGQDSLRNENSAGSQVL